MIASALMIVPSPLISSLPLSVFRQYFPPYAFTSHFPSALKSDFFQPLVFVQEAFIRELDSFLLERFQQTRPTLYLFISFSQASPSVVLMFPFPEASLSPNSVTITGTFCFNTLSKRSRRYWPWVPA